MQDEQIFRMSRSELLAMIGHDRGVLGTLRDDNFHPVVGSRKESEISLDFVHFVTYNIFVGQRGVLAYNRGRKGGEKRLSDKWSIGVGGHINDSDAVYRGGGDTKRRLNFPFTVVNACLRENREELGIGALPCFQIGYIYDDSTEVNSVHVGSVRCFFVDDWDIDLTQGEIEDFEWRKSLSGFGDSLEPWSQFLHGDGVVGLCMERFEQRRRTERF